MTDQAMAMAKAIRIVFPNSRHRLCTWHINENAKKNIKGLRQKEGFTDLFDIVLKYTDTVAEFEHYWSSMLDKFQCQDNKWIMNLYNIREMWCPAYSKDYFSGVWADIGLLEHARKIYTIALYLMFEDNFISGVPCIANVIAMQPPLYEYHVGHPKKDLIKHIVAFDESMVTVDCTCKYFGEVGLLCKHSLRVLHLNNITYIPSRYIVKRWTKGAMCARIDDNDVAHEGITPPNVWRLHNIRTFIRIVDRAQYDTRTRNVIEESIDECTNRINLLLKQDDENVVQESVENQEGEVVENQEGGNLLEQVPIEKPAESEVVNENQQEVKDPIKRRKKG
ncbi:protein FAR1-RELATED SEQUENCE 7-like [Chenopodium quinoa]|nr:protein FAR1-RELATED SEQUENCE 7-like [Chenopodium quinoa]